MNLLDVNNVEKKYGNKSVLQNISFSIPENCLFGLVGRNGAGKTTLMKTILTLIPIDAGEIIVCGETATYGNGNTNKYIGYLPDVPEFYSYMNAREYLKMCGEITGMKKKEIEERIVDLLRLVGLSNEKHILKGYSRGMKQRLGIAQALINTPKLLICDEPTSALDPVGRKELLDILKEAKEQTSILFSTHILSDVERICDTLAILEGGKLVISGPIEEIKKVHGQRELEVVFETEKEASLIHNMYSNSNIEAGRVLISKASREDMEMIMMKSVQEKLSLLKIEWKEVTIEDLFMEAIEK